MMHTRILTLFIACLALLLTLSLASAQTDNFSRREMLEHIGTNIILPLHEQLLEEVTALDAAAQQLHDQPSLDTLVAAQDAWRAVMRTWRQVSLFALGRQTLVLHSAIESSAASNVSYVEVLIGDQAVVLDESFLSQQGSNLVGMPTLEYLLFGMNMTPEAQTANLSGSGGERRLDYIVGVSRLLTEAATNLLNYWHPDGENYLQTFVDQDDATSVGESINMLVNTLIAGLERMTNADLAIPLGLQSGRAAPELVRTPYSDATLDLMGAVLDMVRQVFTGERATADGPGLNALIDSVGAERDGVPLSRFIVGSIDQVSADLDAITFPMRDMILGDYTPLTQLYDDLRSVYLLIKTDMVNKLGLTITFSDADGD
jgi:predicted lipoprotein